MLMNIVRYAGIAGGVVCILLLTGCLGRFAANQGRRQAARSANHYVQTYGDPYLYQDDAEGRRAAGEARNEMVDTIVRSGNPRQTHRVGVSDSGWLTKEERIDER